MPAASAHRLDDVVALLPHGLARANLAWADGALTAVERLGPADGSETLLALPGIVDLHGDAFERQIMPRPAVAFPLDLAVAETDRQFGANGITTGFHAITAAWEDGLRGHAMARDLMDVLDELGPGLHVDHRLHLRFETYNLDGVDEAVGWITSGRIDFLAFNDHFHMLLEDVEDPARLAELARRGETSEAAYVATLHALAERADEVPDAIGRVAAAARAQGIRMASHDDRSIADRARFAALGCEVCEFPLHRDAAQHARAAGQPIVMGAPNVVRGRSHGRGGRSAAAAVAEDLCTVLASDYYYPAPLHAAFRLAADGVTDLAAAWRLVSLAPARAAGLTDRGAFAVGQRADLVLVDAHRPRLPRVAATIVAGEPAYRTRAAADLV